MISGMGETCNGRGSLLRRLRSLFLQGRHAGFAIVGARVPALLEFAAERHPPLAQGAPASKVVPLGRVVKVCPTLGRGERRLREQTRRSLVRGACVALVIFDFVHGRQSPVDFWIV